MLDSWVGTLAANQSEWKKREKALTYAL